MWPSVVVRTMLPLVMVCDLQFSSLGEICLVLLKKSLKEEQVSSEVVSHIYIHIAS